MRKLGEEIQTKENIKTPKKNKERLAEETPKKGERNTWKQKPWE